VKNSRLRKHGKFDAKGCNISYFSHGTLRQPITFVSTARRENERLEAVIQEL
jgi:hypothetical protein